MPSTDALIAAIKATDLAAIDQELAAGVDINALDESGKTPLIHAVLLPKPNKALVGELVDRGADPNICDGGQGFAPLAYAIQVNRLQTAKLLLEKGADPNTRDLFGNTPLFRLVFAQKAEKAVRLLLMFGADKDATNQNGASPRQVSANALDPAVSELLG